MSGRPGTHIEQAVWQTLLQAEKILVTLASKAERIDSEPVAASSNTSESGRDLLARASTQESSSEEESILQKKKKEQSKEKKNSAKKSSAGEQLAPKKEKELSEKDGDGQEGLVVSFSVKVHKDNAEKLVRMSIECPDYKPKRIMFDGQWKTLQPE